MNLLDFDIMKLLTPGPTVKLDKYCSICNCGNPKSERIRVCTDCQSELMPDEQDNEEPIEHPSIACYDGFIHQIY